MIALFAMFALAAGLRSGSAMPAQAIDPGTGVVHSRRLLSGVPLGGIGAGSFRLMTDGTVSRAEIANNWSSPTGDLRGCFGAVFTRSDTAHTARVLALSSGYGLPAVSQLDFIGLFPEAELACSDAGMPVLATISAFSPLIPNDLKNSSVPGALVVVNLRNRSTSPVEASVALSWENMIAASVPGSVATATVIPSDNGFFGMRFQAAGAGNQDAAAVAAGSPAGDMSVVTSPPFPRATVSAAPWNSETSRPDWWDRFASSGDVASAIRPGAAGYGARAGVIAVRFTLGPHQFAAVPFAISWNMPHLNWVDGSDIGHYYALSFHDSASTARALLTNRLSLKALTDEWQNRIIFSDMPRPLTRMLINSAAPLVTHSVLGADGHFALLAGTGADRPGVSGLQQGLIDIQDRLAVSGLLVALFPQLDAAELAEFADAADRRARMPLTLGVLDGSPYSRPPASLSAAMPLAPVNEADVRAAAAYAIQFAQYVDWTGDAAFLLAHFHTVRRSMIDLLDLADGGLPNVAGGGGGSHNLHAATAIEWLTALKSATRLASEAAARALQQPPTDALEQGNSVNELMESVAHLAVERREDVKFVSRVNKALVAARATVVRRYWTGSWFTDLPDQGAAGAGSSDQLMGAWAATMLGDPLPLDAGYLRAASATLDSLTTRTAAYPFGAPYHITPAGDLPGGDPLANVSTLPSGLLAQAALDFRLGKPDEAITVASRVSNTETDALQRPWSSPSGFQADTGAPLHPMGDSPLQASGWYLCSAVEGFAIDIADERLTIEPALPGLWRSLRAPVFASTFWGRLNYRPLVHGYILTLLVDRTIPFSPRPTLVPSSNATLTVSKLCVPAISGAVPGTIHVSLGRSSLGVRTSIDLEGAMMITLDTPVSLAAGDRLEVEALQ